MIERNETESIDAEVAMGDSPVLGASDSGPMASLMAGRKEAAP